MLPTMLQHKPIYVLDMADELASCLVIAMPLHTAFSSGTPSRLINLKLSTIYTIPNRESYIICELKCASGSMSKITQLLDICCAVA